MASSSPECPLCLQPYDSSHRTPRTLPCTHIACTTCLVHLSASNDSVILCPFDCSECKTPVTELPVATSLFKRPRLEESSGMCTLCDEEHPATHRCEDCGEFACEVTAVSHAKLKATKGHRMTPLPSSTAASSSLTTFCPEHNLEFTDFDTQCDVPVCVRCLSHTHHGHKCTTLKDAASEWRTKLDSEVHAWRERAEKFRGMGKAAGDNIKILDESRAVAEKTIKDTFQELHSLLTARELTLLDEVASIHKAKSFELSAHLDHVQGLAEGLERAIEEAKAHEGQSEITLLTTKHAFLERTKHTKIDVAGESGWEVHVAVAADVVADVIKRAGAVIKKSLSSASIQGTYVRHWGSKGNEQGQFKYPTAVAVHNDEVFVADNENNRVQVFTKDGRYLRQIGTGQQGEEDGDFNSPSCVVISAQMNEVFITDQCNDRIQVFTVAGVFLHTFGTEGSDDGELMGPTAIALSPAVTELYVCDMGNHRVQVFSALDGTYLRKWGSEGKGPGQFQTIEGIAVSRDGQMVCVSEWGYTDAPHRVQVFTPSGHMLHVFGGARDGRDGIFDVPLNLAFTMHGTLLVCDYHNNAIQEMNVADGTVVKKLGKEGNGQGELVKPTGVAVSEDGKVYVCDGVGNRVQVFV